MKSPNQTTIAQAILALALLVVPLATSAETLEWKFDKATDVTQAQDFNYIHVGEGILRGWVRWDPFFYLRLPKDGFDAMKLRYLTVRLFSSAPGDALDVYYQASSGEWGLMGKYPVKAGWAIYRMDMTSFTAHETNGSAGANKWGGKAGRVTTLRLDPGNEANRWVMVSSVVLSDQPLQEGVTVEPRGQAELVKVTAPERMQAGETIKVGATFAPRNRPAGLTSGIGYVKLLRGDAILGEVQRAVDLGQGEIGLEAGFPTSKYMAGGKLSVQAGVYELDPVPAAPFGTPVASFALVNPKEGQVRVPQMDVRRLAGDPAIHIDGKPLAGLTFVMAGGDSARLHGEFAKADIHLYTDWFGSSTAGELGHVEEKRYDYGQFDAYFAQVLDTDPDALFMPHLYVTPPGWWQLKHPEEACKFSDGTSRAQSFASERWRKEIGDDLKRLIEHLQGTSYADRIMGYILCSGHSAEWQEWGIWDEYWADYSDPSKRAFHQWLLAKYGTDDMLRAAWRDPRVGVAAAELPTVEQRSTSAAFLLRDPAKEQRVIDFYQYLAETDADAIVHFARVVKQASGGRSLAGAYYGYLTQHWIHQQDSAHLALGKVLDAPEVDFLMSPPMYTGREISGTSTYMSAVGSVKLHGKLWLNESDIRTYKSDVGAGFGRADNVADSRAILQREFGEMLARRTATSWFDMTGGWFSDKDILADMALFRREADREIAARKPFHGDIAVFISAESAYRMRPSAAWMPLVLDQVVSLPRIGVPADVYLLSDINRPDFPEYKVYVFLNACYVDAATRQSIEAKVKRRDATAVWELAPGAITDEGVSAAGMSALTGIRLAAEIKQAVLQVKPDTTAALCKGLSADQFLGWKEENGPVIWADDPQAEVLGALAVNGKPGLVRKRLAGWTSIYCASLGLPPVLLRNIAREAGAHVYLDTDDALDTDGQYACIHAKTTGQKTLRLPARRRVADVMTGSVMVEGATEVRLDLKAGETALLRLETP